MAEPSQEEIQEFERNRAQLSTVSTQKSQLQMQSTMLNAALEELSESKEKKVYKAVGNIMVLSDSKKVEKELKDQKESADLRLKSLQKQEEAILDKLNKLKNKIEGNKKNAESDSKSN